jgi:hypothetical protein
MSGSRAAAMLRLSAGSSFFCAARHRRICVSSWPESTSNTSYICRAGAASALSTASNNALNF